MEHSALQNQKKNCLPQKIMELHLKLELHILRKGPTLMAPIQFAPTKPEDLSPDAGQDNAERDHV